MDLLLVSATPFEVAPVRAYLEEQFVPHGAYQYQRGALHVSLLITGAGLPLTAYALGALLARRRFDLAVNAGIAGAFDRQRPLGEVVQVIEEQFADLGVEEADGAFTDVHRLGLIDPDQPPFRGGVLRAGEDDGPTFLPRVRGISVNRVHGYPPSIDAVRKYYNPDVETMEGAAFFYACLMAETPFLEIRALSNYVEARNRANWKIDLAIRNLNEVLVEMIKALPT